MKLSDRILKLEKSSKENINGSAIFIIISLLIFSLYDFWVIIPLSLSALMIYQSYKDKKQIDIEKNKFLERKVKKSLKYLSEILNKNKFEYFDFLNQHSNGVNMKVVFLKMIFHKDNEYIEEDIFKYGDLAEVQYLSAIILYSHSIISSTSEQIEDEIISVLIYVMKDFNQEKANIYERSIIILCNDLLAKYLKKKNI